MKLFRLFGFGIEPQRLVHPEDFVDPPGGRLRSKQNCATPLIALCEVPRKAATLPRWFSTSIPVPAANGAAQFGTPFADSRSALRR